MMPLQNCLKAKVLQGFPRTVAVANFTTTDFSEIQHLLALG
jgi:hypothetical protein